RATALYDEMETVCGPAPARCVAHNGDGSYKDVDLEARYQDVRSLDHRSRLALIGAQASLVTSVVLFIMDRHESAPGNVPYNPKFRVLPSIYGLAFQLVLR